MEHSESDIHSPVAFCAVKFGEITRSG